MPKTSITKTWWIAATAAVSFITILTSPAEAQPSRRAATVLRTPGDKPAAAGEAAGDNDPKPLPGGLGVNFNLEDADLPDLVKAISNITGRRFIYGGKLRQIKASVYSPEKVTAAEAYQAFLSVLQTNGMTVIPHGRFLKIIETPGVVAEATPVIGAAAPVPDEDRYVTRLYRLSHVDATEASNVLTKFKSKEGDITVYAPNNLLVITETGANIQRMMRIIEEIDAGGAGDHIYVEPVNYTSAADLANKLNEVFDLKKGGGAPGAPGGKGGGAPGAPGAPGAKIVADERGNSLVIVANDADYRKILALVAQIDVKQTSEGEMHVMPLQHAACKDLSQTLNQFLSGSSGAAGPKAGGAPAGAAAGARPVGGAAGAGIDDVFEGRVRVTCDEATNSLLTTSSPRDYAALKGVIDKLDEPRRQVFIEAVIMDVSATNETGFGLSFHAGTFSSDTLFYGGNNPAESISSNPSSLQALALGIRGPALEGSENALGISIPAFGVAMHAYASSGDTNILATPHILATDNIPAEISIGSNIPLQVNFPSLGALGGGKSDAGSALASAALLGGSGAGAFGGQRADVGTKIKVIPHVNQSDQVRLELSEEISSPGDKMGDLGAIPINKRTASTTLVVRDQQTVVIGGLMNDTTIKTETKIPILGDIPLLGALFKTTKNTKQKSNLLLVLTPYVIRSQDDLVAIFERKMEERQEFLDRYFVFNDAISSWKPPRDFSRSNGLLEDIRQSMNKEEEKRRFEEESKPKPKKSHAPGAPIAAF